MSKDMLEEYVFHNNEPTKKELQYMMHYRVVQYRGCY